MKINLIIPPSIFLLDERVFPSLGILKIAALLERENYDVSVLDLSGVENFEKVIEDYCSIQLFSSKHQNNLFCITATTPQMPAVEKIKNVIKKKDNGLKSFIIMLGGPHPTLINAACRREQILNCEGRGYKAMLNLLDNYDYVVAGDGEKAIIHFLSMNKNELHNRLIDADNPKSKLFLSNKDFSELPFPARHLIDLKSYKYSIEGVNATSIVAQLGCPFQCGFCGGRESPMLRRIRVRSVDNVMEEITHLHKEYGYKGFMFYDDELNVSKTMNQLMQRLIDYQKDNDVEFRLRGFVKAELLTQEQADLMYKAGFRWLLTGFESGSPRILENINKRATLEDNTRCFNIARKAGLKVKALMSIGHPGESCDTIMETKDWLLKMKPDDFDVTIITTYPGSPYYDYAIETEPGIWTYTYKKTGDRLHAYELDYNVIADYYKGDPDGGYKAYVYTDYLTSEELVKLRDELERDVRKQLGISFPSRSDATIINYEYEHSMGQFGKSILRNSNNKEIM